MARSPKPKAAADKPNDIAESAATSVATIVLADVALRAGSALVRRGIEHGLLHGKPAPGGRVVHGLTVKETVVGTVLAAVARRSVPGAILVGGGLIAKMLIDHYRAKADTPDRD